MDVVIRANRTNIGKYLSKLIGKLENPKSLFELIGAAMATNTRLRISDGVDVKGKSFVPSYRAIAQGGETLRDTGRLMNSITYLATRKGVSWGVPVEFPYAAILNFGGEITAKNKPFLRFKVGGRWVSKKSVKIPARQFVGFTQADQQEVLDIVYTFLASEE